MEHRLYEVLKKLISRSQAISITMEGPKGFRFYHGTREGTTLDEDVMEAIKVLQEYENDTSSTF